MSLDAQGAQTEIKMKELAERNAALMRGIWNLLYVVLQLYAAAGIGKYSIIMLVPGRDGDEMFVRLNGHDVARLVLMPDGIEYHRNSVTTYPFDEIFKLNKALKELFSLK